MSKICIENWGEFKVGDLFDIHPTKAYKLTNNALMEDDGINPVVVNSSFNNGIGGYSNQKNTEKSGILTYSDTTTAESVFYQDKDFIGYPHVQGMYPKGKYKDCWNKYSLLFFVSVFRCRAIGLNYDYVNKFTRESAKEINLKLPIDNNNEIDFEYMESYMQKIEHNTKSIIGQFVNANIDPLKKQVNVNNWESFHLYDIFTIDSGTKLDKAKMDTTVERIDFVGRSNFNNGVTQKVNEIRGLKPYEAGCLTLALGGAYIGSCFVQENPFYTSQNVVVLIPKNNISFEAKQFIATAIFRESQNNYRAFIKELNSHIKRDFTIKLPIKSDGEPDYEYMTTYMKNISSKTKAVFEYINSSI